MNQPNSNIYWASDYRLRVVDINEISEDLISAWADLEARAVEANCFLSPYFVLPALKYLEAKSKVFLLLVEKLTPGNNLLVGVGVFKISKPSKYFPLPHLTGFKTIYSLLSGFLVDKDYVDQVSCLTYKFLAKPSSKWHSLVYHARIADSTFREIENKAAAEFGMQWEPFKTWERAKLIINRTEEDPKKNLSENVHRPFARQMRKLQELGNVELNVRTGESLTSDNINRFLTLENMGWKKEQGTALDSNQNDALFFREMCEKFNKAGRICFLELSLDGTAIASDVRLISGKAGFAFKIGWDPSYSKYSPGKLLIGLSSDCKDSVSNSLDFLDSGSDEDATYINNLWPSRQKMESGFYAITSSGKIIAPLMSFARKVKSTINNRSMPKEKRVHIGAEGNVV